MIPKFDAYHTALHSSFIMFEKYKLFLQNESFSGYIKLDDLQTQCFFFIKEGKDIASFWLSGDNTKSFNPSELPSSLKRPFYISSYRTPLQIVDFFARCHLAQLILNEIAFDSIEFEKFFNQIESKKITGFLEAARTVNEPKKYIYFYNGRIFGYMNIKNTDGGFEKNLDKPHIQIALAGSIIKVYSISTHAAGSTVIPKSQTSSDDPKVSNNKNSVLICYEEIFQMLEKSITSDDFTSIWRTCAIELSQKHKFLNPFLGEFNYEKGKLDLWEQIDLKMAIHAFDELINSIAKKANLPKDGIKAIKDKYLNILVDYEIGN